ncbi:MULTISPECIES: SDR family NAD(P)-dependent oxidoreductase [Streptomyces]|uniref:SDR family NAD(P)-dependent oxidoreductase n=1 Tax=Streptomyces TaxID=1883 RepID=UPI00226F005E|nr:MULTISPECIES: SDR family oxidoreductase [unclassified Streptomyces]MCY0940139.1 SDR family NAD(P)-dependent oxidoreductase [Streptomyces sp. H34-AA3]MCZ4080787.1 SDR family NAD(P)-dependent oxidoreductase [Streptomyces sp. H34-S5]
MGRLAGRRAIVTGGANGIGRAIATAFAREGSDVFFTALSDENAAESTLTELRGHGVRADYILLDAVDLDGVQQLMDAASRALGLPDVLVNNAATATRTAFLDLTPDEYERVMAVNLRFPFFATQAFAAQLRAAGVPGSVINISSLSANSAVSAMAHYQSSKAGLSMLTRGAAYELAPLGIRVNTISPGLTATKANSNQWQNDPELWQERGKDIPLGRPGRPEDLAGAAVFLASAESEWMTGGDIAVDGGEVAL